MFNSNRETKLNPKWEKRYKILKTFVYAFFLAGIFWLAVSILFPSRHFEFSILHPNSSRNTIVGFQNYGEKIIFNAVAVGNFSKAKVSFSLKKNSAPLKNKKVSVRKSYQAFFYPSGKDISDPSDYYMHSLISSGGSVFIVGENKKIPINNPITFESSGFKWENVKPAGEIDLSQYEKTALFSIDSPHPDGTVFITKESGEYFYIKGGEKHELKGSVLDNSLLKKEAILVEEKSLEVKKEGLLKKSYLPVHRYSSVIDLGELDDLIGKDYQFKVEIDRGVEIKKVNVVLQKSINMKNLKDSLSEIKHKLFFRYGFQNAE